MKLMMFDFVCDNGHEFEDLIDPEYRTDAWCHCGAHASRVISPVRIDRSAIALTKGASPESIAHFERVHRERKAIEEKHKAEHGDYGKPAGA